MNKQTIVANLQGPWTKEPDGTLKAPAVILTEGTHCGTSGCLFYPGHVLKASADQWNGVPVTVQHPTIGQQPVSIKHSGDIESQFTIGYLTDARYENSKLKAIINVNAGAARRMGPELKKIKEVSTGLFSQNTEILSEHNAPGAAACAIQIRPDHLALLTSEKGACSWEDGCGIRANLRANFKSGNLLDSDPLEIAKI